MLSRSRSLLIVTDIQGRLAQLMYERETLFKNIVIIIEGCKILGIPIHWLEQYPEGLGPTVPEIASHLEGINSFPKRSFSALKEPTIIKYIMDIHRKQILLSGIETHICVYQTSMDLLSRGFEVHVIRDAVSSRTLENKTLGINKIIRAGGHETSVETALFELLEFAEGKAFKDILSLVK